MVRRAFGEPPGERREDMTLTRWKLLAGLLGLSMAGVAATADPPCPVRTAGPARGCPDPCAPRPLPPPVVVCAPVVPVETVQVAYQPAVPTLPVSDPVKKAEAAPKPQPAGGKVIELPMPAAPVVQPLPTPAVEVRLEPPTVTAASGPAKPPEPIVPVAPTPDPLPPPVAKPSTPPQRLDPPVVPTRPEPSAEVRDVRVVLRLGAGQPKFEVLSGDDVLLKVVSDAVDVRSPSDKGQPMSALKAAGGVRFSAPGCEGTCSELTVLPGSGDVELAGDVRVRCKQGKGETEIVAAKLTFKLGSAPAYTVPEPAGAVNVSFPRR
jgi:hypothetical protein